MMQTIVYTALCPAANYCLIKNWQDIIIQPAGSFLRQLEVAGLEPGL